MIRSAARRRRRPRWLWRLAGGLGGCTDFPDSDLNFSFRLQQLTSLKVNPDPITMRLTDERLFDYPFIYIIEPGDLSFSREEGVRCADICSMAAS